MKYSIVSISVILILLASQAQGSIVTKGIREIVEALSKKGAKEATEELAEFGGKKAIEQTLKKAAREGGDELVEKVVKYGKRYGLSAVRVIDNAPAHYIKALDGLPEKFVKPAIWAAQREPEIVTKLVGKHGSDALLIAAKHKGIGNKLLLKLGDDGVRLAKALPEGKGVITLAKNADDIAVLPLAQRSQVVDTILKAPARALDFLEKHPRVLLTAVGVTTFLAIKDDVLGKDETITVHPDGAETIRKRGFIERLLEQFRAPITSIIVVIAVIIFCWGIVKIWGVYRREKLKISLEQLKVEKESAGPAKSSLGKKEEEIAEQTVQENGLR